MTNIIKSCQSRDHPRMCGEHMLPSECLPYSRGSSPHVRGTLEVRDAVDELPGIIPACAGNTGSGSTATGSDGDHPRMCGEHFGRSFDGIDRRGSSPHVRGTPDLHGCSSSDGGIIPACAGNTMHVKNTGGQSGDHPRMCGEHRSCTPSTAAPRWIIPACAGNTDLAHGHWRQQRDHPRMCGEHLMDWSTGVAWSGSSPHVRGTPTTVIPCSAIPGIIPACAGNTVSSRRPRSSSRDHPRMCGEHVSSDRESAAFMGSSPHVRGTLYHVQSG